MKPLSPADYYRMCDEVRGVPRDQLYQTQVFPELCRALRELSPSNRDLNRLGPPGCPARDEAETYLAQHDAQLTHDQSENPSNSEVLPAGWGFDKTFRTEGGMPNEPTPDVNANPPNPDESVVGILIDERYRVLSEIGRGGMGIVYRAMDLKLDRILAIKVAKGNLFPGQNVFDRFELEARISAQLQHPGIPPVHDHGTIFDGRPYLTMKLIEGQTLKNLLKNLLKNRVAPAVDHIRFVHIFEQICLAVGYAHSKGVIHRDLNPKNVMIGAFGEVQVMDWGLAKAIRIADRRADPDPESVAAPTYTISESSDLRSSETRDGEVIGTPPYMPPEQARGENDRIGPQSDVFSLGAILCHVLTSMPPYIGDTPLLTLAKKWQVGDAFIRLDECGAHPELINLCKQCLSEQTTARPMDGRTLAELVASHRTRLEERAQANERDRVASEARAEEEAKTRREAMRRIKVERVMMVMGVIFLLAVVVAGWWKISHDADLRTKEANRKAIENERRSREQLALESSVTSCEKALIADQVEIAAGAMQEIKQWLPDGGGEAIQARLDICRADLALLLALNAIDDYRWTPVDGKAPSKEKVATKWAAAFAEYGIVPGTTSPQEAAQRVADSLVRDRLLGALDLWLLLEPSAELRAILSAADPDGYREGVRDSVLAENMTELTKLVGRAETLEQPGWFAAVLGQIPTVPLARRREVLEVALRGHPEDLTILMGLGLSFPYNRRTEAEDRVRWFQAAAAFRPRSVAAHNNLGIALHDKGDLAGAIREYNAAIRLNQQFVLLHNNLGFALRDKGDLEGATREFSAAINIDPNFAEPHSGLGIILKDLGDLQGAIREFGAAIAINAKAAHPHNGLGAVMKDQGDREGAIREFQTAIKLDPKYAHSHNNLGVVLEAKGDVVGAIREYSAAIECDPKYAPFHNNLGAALLTSRNLQGAIREWNTALTLDSKYAQPHYNLATILLDMRNPTGAIPEFKIAIDLDPKYALAHTGLGNALYEMHDLEGAVQQYTAAIKLDPKYAQPHNGLGNALFGKGNRDGAIREYQAAIAIDPNLADAHNGLGNALKHKDDLDGAMAEYKIAIGLNPKSALPHNGLGNVLKEKRNLDGAMREYAIAITLDPRYAEPHYNLGNALLDKRNLDGAMREYVIAITLDPKFVRAHNNLGYILQVKGDRDGAIAAYREAARLKIHLRPTYQALAMLLAKRGESAAALRVLRDGLLVDPQFITVYRYDMACYACLVAGGQAKDAPPKMDRPGLRRESLGWLTDELALARTLANAADKRPDIHQTMEFWLNDPRIQTVRDVEKLPSDEREAWVRLWTSVRQLWEETAPCEAAPPLRLVK